MDGECRLFNARWNSDYYNNAVLCLICNETIPVLKEYNIHKHYKTKHSKSMYAELKGQYWQEKVLFLKDLLTAQI